jgi:hypothetical protein
MYDEMRFLFTVNPYVKNSYNDTETNKVASVSNPVQSQEYREEYDDKDKTYYMNQYIVNKDNVKNFIKSNVNKPYNTTNSNPYIELINDTNQEKSPKSLRLKSSDFAYLRDIGVMPLNRLMILRRFSDGSYIKSDLNDCNAEPISVVVGWVKKDTNMLNFSFNEVWKRQGSDDMLHLLLNKMVKNEFGVDLSSLIPIPGWGNGFLFGILHRMGLTDYNAFNLPIGDPNVLKESITRPHEEFGLESSFNFELETVYEQKYIAGIDPTAATLEILVNLLRMGTSNVRTIGKTGSVLEKGLKRATENPSSSTAWSKLIGDVVMSFTEAINGALTDVETEIYSLINNKMISDDAPTTETKKQTMGEKSTENLSLFRNMLINNPIINSILASTLARYQWPLRGSIGMFTGEATTPWHLTIGNPYAPLLSMNNIYCKNVSVTFGKDMAFNDIPRTIEVKISLEQGRSLGKQEIYSFFGINYKRYYSKV